jgi:uncharacterized membrane protein YfcA
MLFDLSPLVLAFVGIAAFATAVMGGIAGIGTAIAMIPVMAFAIGVRDAIPVVTVAVTMNNFGRVWANRHFIDYKVVLWFSLGAVPLSVLGGVAFANAPAEVLARALAIFLISLVAYRHLPIGRRMKISNTRYFSFVGMVQGFLSSIFGGAGPFGAHFFLAYGLYRNAFVGTVALATTSINLAKGSTYARFALIGLDALLLGVLVGVIMVIGAYFGGRLVSRVPDKLFVYIVEGVMLGAAAALLIQGA